MKSKKSSWITVVLAFLAGIALATTLIWNPGQWKWAEDVVAHLHSHSGGTAEDEDGQLWTCGMHPQVIQDEPGICPICNMNLTPLKQETAPKGSESAQLNRIGVFIGSFMDHGIIEIGSAGLPEEWSGEQGSNLRSCFNRRSLLRM